MSSTRVAIIWNPSKTTKEDLETALQNVGGDADREVKWFETQEDDPGQGAVDRALEDGADVVIAAGGDGTVRAVAERLAQKPGSAELGIIPLGTGNLLARNLDVPLNNTTEAFRRALTEPARPLDVGWVEVALSGGTQRHAFTVMAGFGIDAHMITETDDDLKSKAGWLAYVESLGRAISASEVIDITLALDDAPAAPEQAHTLIVGNCGALQGGMTLLPDADPRDGVLDVLVLHADGISGWMDTMRNLVWDNGLKRLFTPGREDESAHDTESTSHRQITSATVMLNEPRVFEVDGDELGETTRVQVSIQPAAIQVR